MTIPIYMDGADLPDIALTWLDDEGNTIDFSSGWTFELRAGTPGSTAIIEKTTGLTGAAAAPNVTVSWDEGELDDLTHGIHYCDVIATRTADGKDRHMRFKIRRTAAVNASA